MGMINRFRTEVVTKSATGFLPCSTGCDAPGLAILPVRYAVVPENIPGELPDWAQDSVITDTPLHNGDKYAIRAMRQGYLYVFCSLLHPWLRWQCWSIASNGSLWRQAFPNGARSVTEPLCNSLKHDPINVEFFCLESPETCGDIWLAYSQYPWSQETLNHYQQDENARNARMQKFSPQAWRNGGRIASGTEATEQTINQILDYRRESVAGLLPGPDNLRISHVSQAEGLWAADNDNPWQLRETAIRQVSTLYPWASGRGGKADETLKRMQARSIKGKPLILPLWDPVGITHELNGWCQDVLGRKAQFDKERELELATESYLDTLKAHIMTNETAPAELPDITPSFLEQRYRRLQQEQLMRGEQDYAEVMQTVRQDHEQVMRWAEAGVPKKYLHQYLNIPAQNRGAYQQRREDIRQIAESQHLQHYLAEGAWNPYLAKLHPTRRENFQHCHQRLLELTSELFQRRMDNLLRWLDIPVLHTVLDDFAHAPFQCGIYYQSAVGMALNGINHCPTGAEKLDNWWRDWSTRERSNLLWRHVAANNPLIIQELEPLLETVKQQQHTEITSDNTSDTLSTLMAVSGGLAKFTEFYQKAGEGHNMPLRANASPLEYKLHRLDAFVVTSGERLARLLPGVTRVGEYFATTAFRLVFIARTGVPLEFGVASIQNYLDLSPGMRRDIEQAIRHNQHGLQTREHIVQQRETMDSRMRDYFASDKGQNEWRLVKVNLLLLMFNTVDFLWLCHQFKQDKASLASLMASGLALAGQTVTLILPAMEFGLKAQPSTVTRLKGAGATLGIATSMLAFFSNKNEYQKAKDEHRFALGGVLFLQTVVDGLGGLKLTGTLLELIGKGVATRIGEGVAAFFLIELFGIQVFMVAISWPVAAGLLLLQILFNVWKDNELQTWCEDCVFGRYPVRRSLESQEQALKQIMEGNNGSGNK